MRFLNDGPQTGTYYRSRRHAAATRYGFRENRLKRHATAVSPAPLPIFLMYAM